MDVVMNVIAHSVGDDMRLEPMPTVLVYEPKDPLAVRMEFFLPDGGEQPWTFARDLLIDAAVFGMNTGEGYIHLQPGDVNGEPIVMFCFRNRSGHGHAFINRAELREFVRQSLVEVPREKENCAKAVDAFLKEVLPA
jgi:hypothetical protein